MLIVSDIQLHKSYIFYEYHRVISSEGQTGYHLYIYIYVISKRRVKINFKDVV